MSRFEDRLLQILELREKGKDDAAIGKALKLSPQAVQEYEQRAKQTLEEILPNADSITTLARKIQMTKTVTGMAMEYFGLSIAAVPKSRLSQEEQENTAQQEERITQVTALSQQGKTYEEAAATLGLSKGTLYQFARTHGIPLATKGRGKSPVQYVAIRQKLTPAQQAEIIVQSLHAGERSLEVLVRQAQTGLYSFHKVCQDFDIPLPKDIIPYPYRPDLDDLINQGFNLQEITQAYTKQVGKKLTRQAAEQYIAKSGQKHYWERKKEERKEREAIPEQEELQETLWTLQALKIHLTTLARKEGWASEKAMEDMYTRAHSFTFNDFQKTLQLFQIYDEARQRGEKISVGRLAERSGWHASEVSRILLQLKIPTLCRMQYRPSKAVIAQKKERIVAIIKAGLPLSAPDIEYFAKINQSSVSAYIQEAGLTSNTKANGIQRFGFGEKMEQLDYRLASKLYEAKDAGLNRAQIQEYAGSPSEELMRYAFKHREDIEPFITVALQLLFPEENICKPYRVNTQSLDEVLLREMDPVYRAYQHLSWNCAEVGYFVRISGRSINVFYQRWGGGEKASKDKSIVKSKDKSSGHLNLRAASQIYQLQDQNVPEKKIAAKLHLDLAVIEYAKEHRKEYQKEIITGLQIMFPQERITKPYR